MISSSIDGGLRPQITLAPTSARALEFLASCITVGSACCQDPAPHDPISGPRLRRLLRSEASTTKTVSEHVKGAVPKDTPLCYDYDAYAMLVMVVQVVRRGWLTVIWSLQTRVCTADYLMMEHAAVAASSA